MERFPDGSGVSREAPAPFCEGPVGKFHGSTHHTLHWIMDVSFHDDESRIRKGYAPENIAVIKHAALNLLQKNKGTREPIKQLRKVAGWDNERLYQILQQ